MIANECILPFLVDYFPFSSNYIVCSFTKIDGRVVLCSEVGNLKSKNASKFKFLCDLVKDIFACTYKAYRIQVAIEFKSYVVIVIFFIWYISIPFKAGN